MNLPPDVDTPTAGASPVTTTNTTLSVQAFDDGGALTAETIDLADPVPAPEGLGS